MSGNHPWKILIERTSTPDERAEIAREGSEDRSRQSPAAVGHCCLHFVAARVDGKSPRAGLHASPEEEGPGLLRGRPRLSGSTRRFANT